MAAMLPDMSFGSHTPTLDALADLDLEEGAEADGQGQPEWWLEGDDPVAEAIDSRSALVVRPPLNEGECAEQGPLAADDGAALEELEAALEVWKGAMDERLSHTQFWLAENLIAFGAATSGRPSIAWGDTMAAQVVGASLGQAMSQGAAAAGASIGAGLGVVIGGPPGAVAGFLLDTIGGIGGALITRTFFPPTNVDALVHEAHLAQHALSQSINRDVGTAFATAPAELERVLAASRGSGQAMTVPCLHAAVLQLRAETEALGDVDTCDRSLFQHMLRDWVLENARDATSPRDGVNTAAWHGATGAHADGGVSMDANSIHPAECPKEDNAAAPGMLVDHIDLFAYQTRGHFRDIGVPVGAAAPFFEKARAAEELVAPLRDHRNPAERQNAVRELERILLEPSRRAAISVPIDEASNPATLAAFAAGQVEARNLLELWWQTGLTRQPDSSILEFYLGRNKPFLATCAPMLTFAHGNVGVAHWHWTFELLNISSFETRAPEEPWTHHVIEFRCWP